MKHFKIRNYKITKKNISYRKIFRNGTFKRKIVRKEMKSIPSLLPHQIIIFEKIHHYYSNNDRGKMIIPCGAGKSFIILFYIKYNDIKKSLIIVTSISLVKQFVEICEKLLPYHEIIEFHSGKCRKSKTEGKTEDNFRKIFITTYNSARIIHDCELNFDFVFYDEAHRTVVNKKDEEDSVFKETVNFFPTSKKLFCTATEKIKFSNSNVIKYSMDNKEIYGETIYLMNFDEAIQKNIICDYQVILAIDDSRLDNNFSDLESYCYKQASIIVNIFKNFDIKKLLVFCTSINKTEMILKSLKRIETDFNSYNINNKFSEEEQNRILRNFKKEKKALLLNCKFFSEGMSINDIDSVYFTSNKTSKIEITQNIGRAMRKDDKNPNKKASVFICKDMIYSSDFFETLVEVDSNFNNEWSKKINYYSEDVDLEKIKTKIEECQNRIKFIVFKKSFDSFNYKIQLLEEYEKLYGAVKQKEIYKGEKIGIFFSKIWLKYNKGVLPKDKVEILKKTLSYKKYSSLIHNRRSFDDYISLMIDYENSSKKEVNITTVHNSVNLGNFFARIKKNYKKNILSPEEIEKIFTTRTFTKWIHFKSLSQTDEEKLEKLLKYECDDTVDIEFSVTSFSEHIRDLYKNGKLSPFDLEKYLKSKNIRRTIENYQKRSSSQEDDLATLLEYEKSNPNKILPETIFNGKNIGNIFRRIKGYYKKDNDYEKYKVSIFFTKWHSKKRDFSSLNFSEKIDKVKKFEDKIEQAITLENCTEENRKLYNFIRRSFRKYKNNNLSLEKVGLLSTTKTFSSLNEDKRLEIKTRKGRDIESFIKMVKLIIEYINDGNIIHKKTIYKEEKIGESFYNYMSCYRLNKMSEERIKIVKEFNLF